MSQGALADAAGLDYKERAYTTSRIANYEHGTRAMDIQIIKQLAEILNVDPSWLACFEDTEPALSPAERALLDNFRASDERGRRTISRIAETERPNYITGEERDAS